jgi:glyoxylase-like metal-dependent hydrolase (beta-lactamase superfamily II)
MTANAPVTEVAENIYQVQLPLPFALRIVNCYLLRGDDGWAVIDSGLHTAEGEAAWRAAFEQLAIAPGDLRQLVVTHHHPDHYGMAGWLQDWNGAPLTIYASAAEQAMIERTWWIPDDAVRQEFLTHLQKAGVQDEMLAGIATVVGEIRLRTRPLARTFTTLAADDDLLLAGRRLRVILGSGHSIAQVMLYDERERLLFCADHVLMKITPNIGIWPGTQADPLGDFLASLRALAALEVRLGLPAHRNVIHEWQERLLELRRHHDERLTHIAEAVGAGATPVQAAQAIFNFEKFTFHEMRFAVAEALAHLEYLRLRGFLVREEAGGGMWYRRA